MALAVPASTAPSATQLTPAEANWQYVNHDANGSNYNPQNQINASNVANLVVKWIFPYPGSDATAPGLKTIAFTPGAADPPLVVNGIVYTMTNNMILYALNAASGAVLWTYDYNVNWTAASQTIPLAPAGGHLHGINYLPASNGQPAVISFTGMVCDINGVNALTGALAWSIQNICVGIPGNPAGYLYRGYQDSHPPNVYVKGANGDGIVITAEAGAAPGLVDAARSFMAGYDYKTGALVWRLITQPPRPNGNSSFALQYCSIGYIEGVPCETVISNPAIKTLFQNDWVDPKTGLIAYNSGSSGVWGFYPIDQSKGIVIMGTSQASPDNNGTLRPGPNLFSATLLGINATNGNVLWYFQTTTHDIWDNDCSWNGQLMTLTVNGQTGNYYIKTCKNGYLYVLNELTGKPLYYGPLPGIADAGATMGPNNVMTVTGTPATPGHYEMLGPPTDPETYMRGWPSETTGGGPGSPIPPTSAGARSVILDGSGAAYVESDHAFDGKYVYIGAHNHPANFTATCSDPKPGCAGGGASNVPLPASIYNVTFSATNPITGQVAWTTYIPLPFRGGVTATGSGAAEILLAPEFDGNMYVFNANNGQLVTKIYLGELLDVEASVGATTAGTEQIYVQAGGGGATTSLLGGTPVWGNLVALGLPANAASSGGVSTTTTTISGSVTTITSTSVSTLPASTTTITSTGAGGVTTITSTLPASVTTITSTSTSTMTGTANTITTTTSSGGVSTTAFYGVAAVAVIAIIAAIGLGVMRTRKGT
ncbi:MAG TPA: hypothetical protein VLX56_00580 [Nitrososphaerales archaeon]|nr:hypothetical protein [Nitrososphaerales archaeon]